ncbi:MAG: hypothetical protein ABSB63_01195 [Spirochaetia bacterium]
MKPYRNMIAAAIIFIFMAAGLVAAQDRSVPKSLVKFANEKLTAMGWDAQLVSFVSKDNANPVDVEKLRALDKRWQANDNMADFMKALMGNQVSARLQKQIGVHKYIPEAFIMNAQGTIIGETNQTSTYWKGEQEKFTAAYNGGVGAVWFGTLAYDESTRPTGFRFPSPW